MSTFIMPTLFLLLFIVFNIGDDCFGTECFLFFCICIVFILYVYVYKYLRSQCAYDVALGGLLASVYHLTRLEYGIDQPEEVCIKIFVARRNPRIPSIFWVWKSVDFQEKESYDMLGISYDNHSRQT
ncbi:hypothetical protein JHK84_044938 [Glycine max]|nr:hypothetical protein JHK86_044826 [Glycine max]KAG4951576.1 hypothetical protein JHK85_045443 [Glycine max]KAG5108031.1 hypothetical protein JHK84_044938 [Glycine max]